MKLPTVPPDLTDLLLSFDDRRDELLELVRHGRPVDSRGRYLHWDDLRRRPPPNEWTHEGWWLATSMARNTIARELPLRDVGGQPFTFSNVDSIQEMVHVIDRQASGQILADEIVTNLRSSDRYLVSSLAEEAIRSSQLEGASTTRRVAKELLQSGRPPRDTGERMILNNYEAMQVATEFAASDEPLTPERVLDLHRIVTRDTLDREEDAGRLQTPDDKRIKVIWHDGTILHTPPPAAELPDRLSQLCAFANGESAEGFIHPVVRAVILHFWIGHDHPFVDGNGRTARAIFYWSMLRSGYWLTQYLSISNILHQAPAKYARAYCLAETAHSDLTYFLVYQLEVIQRAIAGLEEYLARKMAETREIESLLHGNSDLNHRQLVIVNDAIRDPLEPFTIQAQARRHRVSYQTARTDLLGLEQLGLFNSTRAGKKFVFSAVDDLSARLAAPRDDR